MTYLCVGSHCSPQVLRVQHLTESQLDAEISHQLLKVPAHTSIDVVNRNHMISGLQQVHYGGHTGYARGDNYPCME